MDGACDTQRLVVGCAQHTDDIEIVFKGARGVPYAYYVKILGFELNHE